ncbi:cyclin-dependent protein kinase inhibitor SMR6-like [Lycium barbarum]|uniref:cyclin-dependent protein kinase inhibitor SMR6-like n=1 Tax=Lycium barbarum TaxID=112863 RepID=UPI00293F1442|nr:cyclin-dependent protein kinase inhibitor SMR6-like [Lycium barbarum]
MGFSKKNQMEVTKEENKKWVIAGITILAPLRPISTKPTREDCEDEEKECPTTPTARNSRIPERLPCPPAPMKRRPKSTCHYNSVREFFNPPDLESVFIRHVERAS